MSEIELYELLDKIDDSETIELVYAYYSIRDEKLRLRVLDIIESLTDDKKSEFPSEILSRLQRA